VRSVAISTKCSSFSVGAASLGNAVIEASRYDESKSLDLCGVAWLEHINLVIGSKLLAEKFYQDFLGFSRDPDAKFHMNLGQQQFHLAENGEPAQKIAGSLGLVVPNLDHVRKGINKAREELKQTMFDILEDNVEEGYMTVSCPWGNIIHLYCMAQYDEKLKLMSSTSSKKMVKLHSPGGPYSADRICIRGKPGIRFVEIICKKGSIAAINRFYEEMLGCNTVILSEGNLAVSVGPGVHLIFTESDVLTEKDVESSKGVHICIYAHNFESLYHKLSARNLIWTNPRFTRLDTCDTWEEAKASRTLRFKDIIDLGNGEKLLEMEHETRPLKHGQYMKVPYYKPKIL